MGLHDPEEQPARRREAVSPQRPLSTYRWEDMRRAKARGGYPWTYLEQWQNHMDHEYELVSPRNPPKVLISEPYDRYEPELGMAPRREGSNESSDRLKRERKFFHHDSLDEEMSYIRRAPHDIEICEEDAIEYDDKDRDVAAPSPGSTTGSRTDMELNTSQVDSSALEDLPLSREARRKQKLEKAEERGPGAAARSLQSIRNQAGRLRAKMRAMKRPKINLPDRPKFNLPDRPKFNLPERPKFNLPERPKFKLPERPKFNLPERPKFNFPDRPKFNFPDRPKFNMPDRSTFNFTLPRTRKVLSEQNQQDGDDAPVHVDTPMVDTPSKRSYFDFRTYPRIFDRKNRNRRELNISAPMQIRPRHVTPPSMKYEDEMDEEMEEDPIKPHLPPRRKGSQDSKNNRWAGKLSELEFMDEENIRELRKNGCSLPFDDEEEDEELMQLKNELRRQHSGDSELDCSESISAFKDKDFGYALAFSTGKQQPLQIVERNQKLQKAPTMDEEDISLHGSDQEVAHSSGSSSDRRRAGVLEEISSDEFFLREKGVSQEDVDVERYLSREIKESFRPTADNSLEKLSLNETELARSYRGTPERVSPSSKSRPPRRTRAAPKPPPRPSTPPARQGTPPARQSTPPAVQQEGRNFSDDERKVVKGDTTWYFNTFPPNKPTRNRRRQLRQKSSTIARKATVPQAPRRSKRTQSEFVLDNTSQWSVEPDQEWLKNLESHIEPKEVEKQQSEPDYIIPDFGTPAAPKRGRKQSTQSRKTDDDARSYISYVSRASDMQEDPGYAYVIKPGVISYDQPLATPPPRRAKAGKGQYPTATKRRRGRPLSGAGTNHFFTMPHRKVPPVRPQRNYATLGPARPPRRSRRASLEDVRSESLQSGAVIKKMMDRPLPPPPRPPRKEKGQDEEFENFEAETAAIAQEAPLALDDTESEDTFKAEKQPTPPEEHVLHANLTVTNAEVVVTQEEVQEETKVAEAIKPSQSEAKMDEVEASESNCQTTFTAEIIQEAAKESLLLSVAEPTFNANVIKTESEGPPTAEEEVIQQTTFSDSSMSVEPEQVTVKMETQQIVTEDKISTTVAEQIVPYQQETNIQAENMAKTNDQETPTQVHDSASVSDKIPQPPARASKIVQSSSENTHLISNEESPSILPSTVYHEPQREEITVSTQTDPLPEDELIDDTVPFETEDFTQTHALPSRALAAPAPAPSTSIDLSPAAAALLEAINSGALRLDLLDVGSLRVSELQAQRMLVSNIDGMALNVTDLQSKGGNLVLNAVQAPMDALAEALLAAAQRMLPPAPPPQIIHVPAAPPPHSDMQCQTLTPKSTPTQLSLEDRPADVLALERTQVSEAEAGTSQSTVANLRAPTPVFTTEQVLALQNAALSSLARSRSRSTTPPLPPRRPHPYYYQQQQGDVDPGIIELGNRLARACCCATLSALRRVVSYTERQADSMAEDTRERSGLQIALCVVLVIVAGLILVASMGGSSETPVHKHHWDFYMPQ